MDERYMLWTFQRVFMGTLPERWEKLTEINAREVISLAPLAFVVVLFGIQPGIALNWMTNSLGTLIDVVRAGAKVAGYPVM